MPIVRCFFLLATTVAWVIGLPVPEEPGSPGTLEIEDSWVPGPEGRGTFGILSTCIITLGLCVWTSIHCDIIPGQSSWYRLRVKLYWMLLAIIAPESVVLFAYRQWRDARRVHATWCEHFSIQAGSPEDRMGREGAFFVVMGGCGVPSKDDKSKLNIVTVKRFIRFINQGRLHKESLNRQLIIDKGKANTFAKLLVCIQASWMIIQSASRKLKDLPISLLEVHVVIQVFCVVLMYGFWWYKPLDINEPLELPVMSKSAGSDGETSLQSVERPDKASKADTSNKLNTPKERGQADTTLYLTDGTAAGGFGGIITVAFGQILRYGFRAHATAACMFLLYGSAHAVAWESHFPTPSERKFWMISCIFVGIGPAASLLVGFVYGIFLCLVDHFRKGKGWRDIGYFLDGWSEVMDTLSSSFLYILLSFILWVAYAVGVMFLTVEAFISLRSLPKGAYQTISWENYLLHF